PDGLARQVRDTGALWVAGALDPLAELVRAQRLAVTVAAARGLDPDRPRHLARSVGLAPRAAPPRMPPSRPHRAPGPDPPPPGKDRPRPSPPPGSAAPAPPARAPRAAPSPPSRTR